MCLSSSPRQSKEKPFQTIKVLSWSSIVNLAGWKIDDLITHSLSTVHILFINEIAVPSCSSLYSWAEVQGKPEQTLMVKSYFAQVNDWTL